MRGNGMDSELGLEGAFSLDLSEQELKLEDEGFGIPKILVIGCGGAGNNTINRLIDIDLVGAEAIAVNTDSQHLAMIEADRKILIGKKLTRGLGSGGRPEVGRKAAEMARPALEDLLRNADMVFITAGMGGGTGTGAAPVIARIAKEQGAIVICMVTTPFHIERARVLLAEEGLESLRETADTLIVLDNNRLMECVPNLPLESAFSVMDLLIAEIIKSIAETITQPSLINLDFADVRTVMSHGGSSFMRQALKNPLLDVDCRGAGACLLHITGGPDMTLKEAASIAGTLTQEIDPRANVIWGARIRRDFKGKVRLMAIITGVLSAQVLGPLKKDSKMDKEVIERIDVVR
jgi:cell division protein FtsZ